LRSRLLLVLALACALVAVAGPGRGEEAAPEPPKAARLHADAAELERALAETIVALSRDDAAAMRAGLDRIERACRRTRDDEPLPKKVLTFDVAFHLTLDRARELAAAKDVEHAAQQFCWIQSACRKCHAQARQDGIEVARP
jgi:hypothetical protein